MDKPRLAFGLNLTKKPGASKTAPARGKPMFDADDDDGSDNHDGANGSVTTQDIGGDFDDLSTFTSQDSVQGPKSKNRPVREPPKLKSKAQTSTMFGDLSTTLSSRKNAEAAAELDASVYEYDSIYDSMKPKKTKTKEEEERKPRYMKSLLEAADLRKRDTLIAEGKRIEREREAEGDEYAGKETFVTEAYKKQQEEVKRAEEEEKRREEEDAKKNKGGGMAAFYKKLLEKGDRRHAETVRAAEEMAKEGPKRNDGDGGEGEDKEEDKEKEAARLAKELNEKGADIAINEDGQAVDKRQLLRGGLNVGAKKKETVEREAAREAERERRGVNAMRHDKKQAMRERQSRMLEEQLEQSLKRSRAEEEAKKEEMEQAAKSRKTEGDISSARERYLARKKAAEAEKSKTAVGP